MTIPSEMTPDELRLAIAEELGYWWGKIEYKDGPVRAFLHPSIKGDLTCWEPTNNMSIPEYPKTDIFENIPNYPGDPNAALGLLIEEGLCWIIDSRFEFPEIGIVTEKSKNLRDYTFMAIAKDNTLEGIARAICEAWLQVRRNNA